ncbi:MAG: hypothetical protein ACI82A_001474 [Candidatus Azotimanducaceae bacterium]
MNIIPPSHYRPSTSLAPASHSLTNQSPEKMRRSARKNFGPHADRRHLPDRRVKNQRCDFPLDLREETDRRHSQRLSITT